MLFFTIQQCTPATIIHTSPPSVASLSSPTLPIPQGGLRGEIRLACREWQETRCLLPPVGGPCHELQPGQGTEEPASVCRAGSGAPQGGTPWTEKCGHLGRGWGSFWSLLIPSPLPGPSTRYLLGSNCLRRERQKERLGRIRPSPSQPFPSPQQKPGSWGEPRLTSREESGLSGAWTREDGTHVDSVASGGIWGSQGAGAPHEIHAAFKVSE